MTQAAIVGVGMTQFGKHLERSIKDLGAEAIEVAVADAGCDLRDIEMAFMANSMASVITGQVSIVGQTILRDMGIDGIPVYNIDNACASSSSALNLAMHALAAGAADTILVVGVEKLYSADRSHAYRALNGAADVEFVERTGIDPAKESVFVAAVYPERLARYASRYSLSARTLAEIAVKNRANAALNPLAQYRKPVSAEEVLASRTIVAPLTALMCAPIGDGASAVVLTRAKRANGSGRRPVWIRASAVGMGTDPGKESSIARVAARAYAQAGVTPRDVDLAEVHDSVAFNELLAYEELGLCSPGEGARLVAEGDTALGGAIPVNTSGGLESRGHPVAATGLAQVIELVTQLRGDAGDRQVSPARVGLAENAGGYARDDTAAIAVTVVSQEPGE
jgi:acetyl-CoA acyltransferase